MEALLVRARQRAAARDTLHARARPSALSRRRLTSPHCPRRYELRGETLFYTKKDAVDDSTLGLPKKLPLRAVGDVTLDLSRGELVLVVPERHQRVHLRLPSGDADADGSTRADITALAEWKEAIGAARARAALAAEPRVSPPPGRRASTTARG